MKPLSAKRGSSTSGPEITQVSRQGIWLLLDDRELFMPFEQFPWFRTATIEAIHHVEQPHPRRLYWPDLDIDLAVESIESPDKFPLISAAH